MNEEHEVLEDENKRSNLIGMVLVLMVGFLLMVGAFCLLTGCTLSFQNVMTKGTASDVVDSEPKNDVTANPQVTVPFKPL